MEQREQAKLIDPQMWAIQNYGSLALGDVRRTKRAVQVATALARQPASSLPGQFGDWHQLKGAYRLLHNNQISHAQLIAQHLRQTRQSQTEISGSGQVVLLIQDTTELDYTSHQKTSGLSQIGNGKGQGFLVQSVLAVGVGVRPVAIIGLADQQPFLRQSQVVRQTSYQRRKRERESQVWLEAVRAIGQPKEPEKMCWVHVGDRGSDFFEFFEACKATKTAFLVRAAQDRCLELKTEGVGRRVLEYASSLRPQARQTLELPARAGQKARSVELSLAYARVKIKPPKPSPKSRASVQVSLIRVWEENPPAGVAGLEWILLSSLAVESLAEAWQLVEWYRLRWLVEEYHHALKTGCRIEQRRLGDGASLQRLLAFLAPLAVRLLQLRQLTRQAEKRLATSVVEADLVEVVAQHNQRKATDLTIHQFWRLVAKRGGFLGRKHDGEPGWQTLWQGWLYYLNLLEGVRLANRPLRL